ncbi:MAG: histidine kinase [Bacteroidales bacterium]|nr:histidine kinase [Bacteroidales bacterium]
MRLALYNTDNGVVKYFNENLKLVDSYQSVPFESIIYPFDLDGDGVKEEVYFGLDMDHIVVARNDFTRPAMVKFNGEVTTFYFSENWVNGKPAALCLNLKNKYCEFKYKRNPYYTYRYLIYGAMFLLILLLVNLIGFYYQRLLKIRYRAEEKMRDLQQQAIEQQLTPHFTLNILNSIGAMYENRKTETARIYMGKYSKLLRENLLASGDITTSFQQELDFVKNYLDLEQFRYNNKFTYSISCAAVSIPVQLPRLFIYTFVENALKHGLFHIMGSQPAHIDIHCLDQEKYWKVEISDNGIGRKESSKIKSFSTGKGLEIIQETLKLYQSLKHRRITFIMEDLNPEQTYTGTKVTILIQKKTNAKKRN